MGTEELKEKIRDHIISLKDLETSTKKNFVYECILKEGMSLNSSLLDGKVIDDQSKKVFYIAFTESVDEKLIDKIASTSDNFKEETFICLDSALTDDLRRNISKKCKLTTF